MNVSTLLNIPHTVKSVGRVREILMVLMKHGFGELIDQIGLRSWLSAAGRVVTFRARRESTRRTIEERIRMVFEDLGPAFVKLGQVLATRPDLIPMSLITELRKLQDDVPPFPMEAVRALVQGELGDSLENLYAHFDETPLAAASIGQVHRARLKSGEEVVVKVQRPELQRTIERDLRILAGLAQLIHDKTPDFRKFKLPDIVAEFSTALRRETDFTNERWNMDRFCELWADDPLVSAPTSYPALCTARVLTMGFVDGVKVTDTEGLEAIGVDPREVAQRGTRIALTSIFEHGFFHADPHPGNFFVLAKAPAEGQTGPQAGVTLIDFGMMGVVDRERLDELLTFLVSVVMNDPEMMVRLFVEMDLIEDTTDLRALKRDIKTLTDRYLNVPVGEIDLGRFLNQVFDMVMRHDVQMPADLLLVGKALTTMQGIAQEIDPSYDPIAEMRPYLVRTYVMRVLDPAHHARELARDFQDLTRFLRKLPGELRALLKRARRGELRFVQATEDLDLILARADRRANRALAVGIGGLLSLVGVGLLAVGDKDLGYGCLIFGAAWGAWAWWGILRSGGV